MEIGDDKSNASFRDDFIDKPSNARSLFRPEATAFRNSLIGTIHLPPDLQSSKFLLFAFVAISISLAFFFILPIERKAKAPGVLMPLGGATTVTAQQHSFIEKILVEEGQPVNAGQPLVKLFVDRKTIQNGALIDVADRQTKSLSAQLESLSSEQGLRSHQFEEDLSNNAKRELGLKNDLNQLLIEAGLVATRRIAAEKDVARHSKLVDSGFLSLSAAQAKIDVLNDIQAREVELERSIQNVRRQLEENESARKVLGIRAAIDVENIKRARAEIENQLAETATRGGAMLTSPMKGVVSTITLKEGTEAAAGQAVLTVLSANDPDHSKQPVLEANLFLPSRLIGFCQVGQPVKLRYAAYPYQKFGMHVGSISAISGSPINSQDLPPGLAQSLLTANTTTEPLYRIRVQLTSQQIKLPDGHRSLKAGMIVDGDVIQESRSIAEWAAEPIIAAWRRTR